MADIKILGIAGSLRKASFNRAALKAAQGLVPAGATLDILDLPDLPGFNQDQEKSPPAAVTSKSTLPSPSTSPPARPRHTPGCPQNARFCGDTSVKTPEPSLANSWFRSS